MRTCPTCGSYLLGSDAVCTYCKTTLPAEATAQGLETDAPSFDFGLAATVAAEAAAPIPVEQPAEPVAASVAASEPRPTREEPLGSPPASEREPQHEPERAAPARQAERPKWLRADPDLNENAVTVASLIVPGLGQMIKGHYCRGYAFLLGIAICNVLGLGPAAIALWLWNAFDAYYGQGKDEVESLIAAIRTQLR